MSWFDDLAEQRRRGDLARQFAANHKLELLTTQMRNFYEDSWHETTIDWSQLATLLDAAAKGGWDSTQSPK